MTMLVEHVDVVIGIDTHKHTHTAAVVAATTGAVLETITVAADPDGYGELVELADAHAALRAWAIEGTGTYGADLTRVLQEAGELVHELDRPKRPKRRMGEKNDELDAIRTARDALAREHNGTPRRGANRVALAVLLAGRRSAVDAAKVAHIQRQALICAAPSNCAASSEGSARKTLRTRRPGCACAPTGTSRPAPTPPCCVISPADAEHCSPKRIRRPTRRRLHADE